MAIDPKLDCDSAAATTYYTNERRELFQLLPASMKSLLDVGCGEGYFGAAVKRQRPDIEVWGIEPTTAAIEASRRLDRVISSSIENALGELPDASFDCITFNDSLEHLMDPWSTLRAVRGKLAHSGCVIASIPNLRFYGVMRSLLVDGTFEYADQGILDRTHLRFFTQHGMRALFWDSGYRVQHMHGINHHPLPIWLHWASRLVHWRFHDMQFMQYALVAEPR